MRDMSLPYAILNHLSDGSFHSGESLARAEGVTRASIWKSIQTLQNDHGLDIYSVHGRGYRLAMAIELLNRDKILAQMPHARQLASLQTFFSIDSTNHYLMHAKAVGDKTPCAVLAEQQTAGRGRRGRSWQSPFAGNLYASLLWRFNQVNANFAGLSLVSGVVVCRVLQQLGIAQLGLKWPNDVLCQGRKLCGILIEMRGESHGPYDVVIGIGLNLMMPDAVGRRIDQPWIALQELDQPLPSRNTLAARILDAMLVALAQFEANGLTPFLEDWRSFDQYCNQQVVLHQGGTQIPGIARGVDEQGALLVEHSDGIKRYFSGEISLRMQ